MAIKASVSITQQQDDFARALVAQGHYPSLSAVVQRGLEVLRSQAEREAAELDALQNFFEGRIKGAFVTAEEGRANTEEMISEKRRVHGI